MILMENQTRVQSFPPIVDDQSRVLVLGTMPGVESLRQQKYYAYDRNHFWSVLFALYGLPRPDNYVARIQFLLEKHIALWDVLESCVRPGSADADIRHAVPNQIPGLLEKHPGICAVFPNGKGAERLFRRFILPKLTMPVEIIVLPSTSPAHASMSFEQKLEGWKPLLEYLGKPGGYS